MLRNDRDSAFIKLSSSGTADTIIGEKLVPKDTLTLPQIHSVMRNETIFPNPDEFRPERFLEEDGKTANKVIKNYWQSRKFGVFRNTWSTLSRSVWERGSVWAKVSQNTTSSSVKILSRQPEMENKTVAWGSSGLARMELFLILGTLLLKYRFEKTEPTDLTPVFGSIIAPRPHKCNVVPI